MALEPFSTNSEGNGLSGVGGYSANSDQRSPAFGRSSRDIASDAGPGAAAEATFTTPDTDTETTSGTGKEGEVDHKALRPDPVKVRRRLSKTDPDERLGLRPAISGIVAPRHPVYPATGRRSRGVTAGVAGVIAAAAAAAVSYGLYWSGLVGMPASQQVARTWLKLGTGVDVLVGIVGALLAGALGGMLFGLAFKRPTLLAGMAWGVVATIVQWVILAPATGRPVFYGLTSPGIALPLLINMLIWGTLLGYLCGRWLRPPYSAAVDPDLTTGGAKAK